MTELELPKSMLEALFETWLARDETQADFKGWLTLASAGKLEAPDEARRLRELQEHHSPARRLDHREHRPESPQRSASPSQRGPHKKSKPQQIGRLRSAADDVEAASASTEIALAQLWARFSGIQTEDAILGVAAFAHVAEVCALPKLLGTMLFERALHHESTVSSPPKKGVSLRNFLTYFRKRLRRRSPKARLFEVVAKPGAAYIEREDWVPILDCIVREHPGLKFLQEHSEFQEKYATTCIVRIFYRVNLSRTGKMSRREVGVASPCILGALEHLGNDDDINRELAYFSYEHFYVLYCRFWELDSDRDSLLTRDDVLKYGGHRLSRAIVDRIFEAAPRPYGDGDCGEKRRRMADRAAPAAAGAGAAGAGRSLLVSPDGDESTTAVVPNDNGSPSSAFGGTPSGEQFADYSDDDDVNSEATDELARGGDQNPQQAQQQQQQQQQHPAGASGGGGGGSAAAAAGGGGEPPPSFFTSGRAPPKRQRRMRDDAADGLSYADFIYFMLSEEDKGNEASMKYWFQCCDVDADGRIDAGDARHFYAMQAQRMECLGHEIVPFEDMVCQMSDMLHPKSLVTRLDGAPQKLVLTLADLLRPSKLRSAGVFFDALFSLDKFVEFEQRDPFMERQKRDDPHETDWDRFAAAEYARLATEDEATDADDYDDEFHDVGRAAEAPF